MKLSSEQLIVRRRILKEISKLRSEQRFCSIQDLASKLDIPAIKDVAGKLINERSGDYLGNGYHQHRISSSARRRNSYCLRPPFNVGGHWPDRHQTISENGVPILYTTFGYIESNVGEYSLSVVAGRNAVDYYHPGAEWEFGTGHLGYIKTVCGSILHPVNIPVPYNYDTHCTVSVDVEFPKIFNHENPEIIKLQAGPMESDWFGLVGAEGYLDIIITNSNNTYSSSFKFLDAWKTGTGADIFQYRDRLNEGISFELPAGDDQFFVQVKITLNTHVTTGYQRQFNEYALIDFRSPDFENEIKIFNDEHRHDHPAPGSIKLKSICVSLEPYEFPHPHTE